MGFNSGFKGLSKITNQTTTKIGLNIQEINKQKNEKNFVKS